MLKRAESQRHQGREPRRAYLHQPRPRRGEFQLDGRDVEGARKRHGHDIQIRERRHRAPSRHDGDLLCLRGGARRDGRGHRRGDFQQIPAREQGRQTDDEARHALDFRRVQSSEEKMQLLLRVGDAYMRPALWFTRGRRKSPPKPVKNRTGAWNMMDF